MSEGAMPAQEPGIWRRLWERRVARVALVILAVMTLAAIVGPFLLPAGYGEVSGNQFSPPSAAHWFGTDLDGRDLLFRVLEGARVSLLVGFSGALISFFIGTAYGLVSGYAGGRVDSGMMRLVEILYAIPRLVIILIFINAFDSYLKTWMAHVGLGSLVPDSRVVILIFCLGVIEWLTMARIVRGQVLSLKAVQFVAAARALGQSHFKILTRHLLPNLLGLIVVYLTLTVPAVILDESFLSFLGLGIQPPQASWGSLLADGAEVINPIRSNWWLLVFPAIAMCVTLLALNFLGDAVREAADPRGSGRR
ncbi:MAG TPA: ABC transporter permease [Chthoniobacteraceae bacterium]|jgi:peptide/nickel transport system permease protein/oligopeptide transport system permease protein|nr:ABC transporter permease [Chthoniobacteraceae bacterium]